MAALLNLTVSQLLSNFEIMQTHGVSLEQIVEIFNYDIGYKSTWKQFDNKNELLNFLASQLRGPKFHKKYILGYTHNNAIDDCDSHMILIRTYLSQAYQFEFITIDPSKPKNLETSFDIPLGSKYYLILVEGINY